MRSATAHDDVGESRWPMAIAIVMTGLLRFALPPELRTGDAKWLELAFLLLLLGVLIIGDPGRIDRESRWLRVMTTSLIGFITLANAASATRLVVNIINAEDFTNNARTLLAAGAAIWVTNVIAFGLWYWDLDRGGAAARARSSSISPALVFPEMNNPQYAGEHWVPHYIDYLHFSFATATAFSPTDVSAIKSWAKVLMMLEEMISLVVALLVVARAVNILK
jgi:hypothetical protein